MTPTDTDDDRFTVRSPVEVAFILRAVMQAGEMVTAYFNDGRDFMITAILAVDRNAGEVLFDASKDSASNRRLTGGRKVSFVTTQDRIKVQFDSDAVTTTTYEGDPAFRIPLPASLLKFQRRDYYRVDTPVIKPVRCRLALPEGHVDTHLVDISLGGVCLTGYPESLAMEPGREFPGCRIDLGDAGQLTADLQVRNNIDIPLRNGTVSRRAGCMFVKLPPGAEAMLQRYIIRLERDRRVKMVDGKR